MISTNRFKKIIQDNFKKKGRILPWRSNTSPYSIFISEVMLQQTQVSRVTPKYNHFLNVFPSFESLAKSSIKELLLVWRGLGYNRRALNLKKAAVVIMEKHAGKIPTTITELDALPGIGPATAAAIFVYTFNKPAIFIETNIRTVYIHFFFKDRQSVTDSDLIPLLEKTLNINNPREFYWSLMDYGAMLKTTGFNYVARSTGYVKQSKFKGSNREVRGAILKSLVENNLTRNQLIKKLELNTVSILANLESLTKEGFIQRRGNLYFLRE